MACSTEWCYGVPCSDKLLQDGSACSQCGYKLRSIEDFYYNGYAVDDDNCQQDGRRNKVTTRTAHGAAYAVPADGEHFWVRVVSTLKHMQGNLLATQWQD